MVRALLYVITYFAVYGPALAQEDDAVSASVLPDLTQWAITLLGMVVAARLATQAFDRRSIPIANVPTFPRYMTSRSQYRLGTLIFVIFACGFFLLLVQEHREVVGTLYLLDDWIPIPKNILQAIKDQSAPYLLVVGAMGAVYLYFLTKEAPWNVLLMMRDVIQRWISIPQLAGEIVAQIGFSLRVPKDAVADVIAESKGLVEQDFRKDSNTPDRTWAETCYMKCWLNQKQQSGEDVTFFTEKSFAFDELQDEFDVVSLVMDKWKSGAAMDWATAKAHEKIKDLHDRISRMVACYLIYRNGSREELCAEASKFGVKLNNAAPENPLRYWIVYVIVLIASVYIGVYTSAITYDLLAGRGLNFDQDSNRAVAWIMYTLCNFGLAILVILLLRFIARSLQIDMNQSHLITYCWTFLVAFAVGPLGLTIAVHFFGEGKIPGIPYPASFTFRHLDGG